MSYLKAISGIMGWQFLALIALAFSPHEAKATNIFDRQGSCAYQHIGNGVFFCSENTDWNRTFAEGHATFSFYNQAATDTIYRASIFIESTSFPKEYDLDRAFDSLKEMLTRSLSESGGNFVELSRERLLDFGGSLLVSYQIITESGSIIATETMTLGNRKMIRLVTYRTSEQRHPGDFQLHTSFKRNVSLGLR